MNSLRPSVPSGGTSSQVHTINRTPAEPTLDGRDLSWLIEQYLQDRVGRLPAYTVDGYRVKLTYFLTWWDETGPACGWQLTRRTLHQFEPWLRKRKTKHGEPLSYHTRNDALRRLRQAFKWAHTEKYLSINLRPWVPIAQGAPPDRVACSLAHLQQLMDAAAQSPAATRDTALLAVLIGTGIRRGEVASLHSERVTLYEDGSGLLAVTGKRTEANRSGKRTVAFDAHVGPYLQLVLEEVQFGPLWRNLHTGRPLTTQGVYKVVKRLIRQAGLEQVIQGPHDLRRAFATHFARLHPGPLYADILRRQLGHAHYSQTTAYTLLEADDLRAHIVSPLANQQ